MNLIQFTLLFCLAGRANPPNWHPNECKLRAQEFYQIAQQEALDPLLLTSISIAECDLRDDKDAIYTDSTGIIARDLCPMGVHINTNSKVVGAGFSRKYIIKAGAKRIKKYQRYHIKHCKTKHPMLNHYNSGYKIYTTGDVSNYSNNIEYLMAIFYNVDVSNANNISLRIKKIGQKLQKELRYVYNYEAYCSDPVNFNNRNCKSAS